MYAAHYLYVDAVVDVIMILCTQQVMTIVVFVQVFDRNKDGFISASEIVTTMQELGIHLSDDDVRCMLDAADQNRDGKIDYKGQ